MYICFLTVGSSLQNAPPLRTWEIEGTLKPRERSDLGTAQTEGLLTRRERSNRGTAVGSIWRRAKRPTDGHTEKTEQTARG